MIIASKMSKCFQLKIENTYVDVDYARNHHQKFNSIKFCKIKQRRLLFCLFGINSVMYELYHDTRKEASRMLYN